MQRIIRPHGGRQAGVSLLEVLLAISLLGVSFATIFSGLSAALRTTDRLDHFDRANDFGAKKLNELVLDPSVVAGQMRSGVSPSGIGWQARTQSVETRPLSGSDKPARLVQITLDLDWKTRSGRQSLRLETLKLCIPESPPSP